MRDRRLNSTTVLAVVAGLVLLFLGVVVVLLLLNGPAQAGEGTSGEPYIRVEPAAGAPGTTLGLLGGGWQPGETVLFYLVENGTNATDGVVYASAVADERGQIEASMAYPLTEPWSRGQTTIVLATGLKSGARPRAAFQVVPALPPTQVPTSQPPAPTQVPLPTIVPTQQPTLVPDPATATPTSVPPTAVPTAVPTSVPPTAVPTNVPPTAVPTSVPPTATPVQITDWRGEYFNNRNLTGAPLVRNDARIDFDWGAGSPMAGLGVDNFSVRWTRRLNFEARAYRFTVRVDDGARLWIDGQLVIDDWRDGSIRTLAAERTMTAGAHDVRLEMYENSGGAAISFARDAVQSYPDWKAEYWSNVSLSGSPAATRNDAKIDFNWGTGAPAQGVPADNFSARWTRSQSFAAGAYRFSVQVDDGARLWVDNRLIVDQWHDGSATYTADLYLTEGAHTLRLEMYERTGGAMVRLSWARQTEFSDWKGEYMANPDLAGTPAVVRNDVKIDFNWGTAAPAAGLPADNFSVRWTRKVNFEEGTYRFCVRADDGVSVEMDDQAPFIRAWKDGYNEQCADVFVKGGTHKVRVEYYDRGAGALIQFGWQKVSGDSLPAGAVRRLDLAFRSNRPGSVAIASQAEYVAFLQEHGLLTQVGAGQAVKAPVAWDQEVMLAVLLGDVPNLGTRLELARVSLKGQEVTVHVKLASPAPGDVTTPVLASPSLALAVRWSALPKGNLTFRFVDQDGRVLGQDGATNPIK